LKNTLARTEYLELDEDDAQWLKTELIRWLAKMSETQADPSELWRLVHCEYWSKRTKTLPKGRSGLNSPASFTGGLINNLLFGDQRDFTVRQTEGIRDISAQICQLFDDLEPIQFRISIL
jgi:hypothetical protein